MPTATQRVLTDEMVEEIRAYFGKVRGSNVRERIEVQGVEANCWRTNDPAVVVAEITHRGWSKVKQDYYTFTAVAIIRLRDGEITRYDDYMNPLLMAELFGMPYQPHVAESPA